MKLKRFVILVSIITLFSGCNKQSNHFDNLPDIFSTIITSKNYTLTTTYQDEKNEDNVIYFTENAYFVKEKNNQYGYISNNDGIYSVNLFHRKLVPSVLLEQKNNLWESELFHSLNKFNIHFISDNEKVIIKDKMTILNHMKMILLDVSLYSTIQNLEVTYQENNVQFSLNYKNKKSDITLLTNLNKTKIQEVDDYLKNGGKQYEPTSEQKQIKQLFSKFNYKRACLDNDNETIIGYEWYNPNYFYGAWEDDYYQQHIGEIYEIGVVGCNNLSYNDKTLNGSYYFHYDANNLQIIDTMPINENPNVTEVYNYPTYLKSLDNFQFFTENTEYENTIFTDRYELLMDFCANFQILETLVENNCTVIELEISYTLSDSDADCQVVFSLYYTYKNQLGAFVFPFVDFGIANIPIVDSFIQGGVK